MSFKPFGEAVQFRFMEMSEGELYVVSADDIFEKYLAAFPEGSNPMFRQRTEHDCQCCKQFVRRLGPVVGIKDSKIITVWGNLPITGHYKVVADALDAYVRSKPIESVFRTVEKKYGVAYNYEQGSNARWDHFVGEVSSKHSMSNADTKRGEINSAYGLLLRGLTTLKADDFDTVLDLIGENGLYKGAEFKPMIVGFRDLLKGFAAAGESPLFVWENVNNPFAGFRNTAIGTLFIDLAEGKDLDNAVNAYEAKVSSNTYKRPKPVITQKQLEAAVATLTDLGLLGAINRRYARTTDISADDVLFVSTDTQLKDNVTALLEGSVAKSKPDFKNAVPLPADEFIKQILPGAKSIEVLVENRHAKNFMSLTGADGPERPFKWPNNFAWAYDGDLADSELRKRVQELGGRVDGVLRFSHRWNYDARNASLMDLHVFMPGCTEHKDGCHDYYPAGQRVGWNQRKDPLSGGVQDVDYVQPAPAGYVPVENITFPVMAKLREGKYVFKIHNWNFRNPTQGGFQAEIEFGGQVFQYEVTRPLKQKEWVTVAVATLKSGVFTIEHKLDSSTTSKDKWGIKTETLVPVSIIAYSPNHWGGSSVGAKHTIFGLKGCKNPEAVRGIFNEYLRPDLDKHRRVFEVLGAKTMCKPTDDQISGVGFTAARGDTVNVVVDGRRAYTLSF